MPLVLLVEDDQPVRDRMARELRAAGFAVQPEGTALGALRTVPGTPVDLILLDLTLPDLDGSEALRLLRGVTDVPVIIATGRDEERWMVRLLDDGADDYLVKPFSGAVLVARVKAVLRRSAPADDPAERPIVVGDLEIDLARREARLAGRPLKLTRLTFDLLAYLAGRLGRVVSKAELSREVWQQPHRHNETIDVHLSQLRRALGETAAGPRFLHTVRGVGIKLVEPWDSSSSA